MSSTSSSTSSTSSSSSSSSSTLPFQNKRVFISGSTSGIGFACASAFAQLGAIVCVNGRKSQSVESAIKKLKELHPINEFVSVPGDLSSASDADEAIRIVGNHLDVLVLNAGKFKSKNFAEIDDDLWMDYFQTNVMSAVRLARFYLPKMLQANNNNRIIFMVIDR